LLRTFIQINYRIVLIIGSFIHIQDIFHVMYGLGPTFRDYPAFNSPGLKFVFFNNCRTLSWLIDSIYSSSTILSARSLNVHLLYPDGGLPHRIATNLASTSPVKIFSLNTSRFLPNKVSSNPLFTNRSLIRSTVARPTPYAFDIESSFHFKLPFLSAANNT